MRSTLPFVALAVAFVLAFRQQLLVIVHGSDELSRTEAVLHLVLKPFESMVMPDISGYDASQTGKIQAIRKLAETGYRGYEAVFASRARRDFMEHQVHEQILLVPSSQATGHSIPILVLTPRSWQNSTKANGEATTNSTKKKARLLVYFHGGGAVLLDFYLVPVIKELAATLAVASAETETDTVVISVEYRLAPEHPYPAGVHDCFDAVTWAVDNADRLGIDPNRISLAGESAGALMAAATAILWNDVNPRRKYPILKSLTVIVPMLSPVFSRSFRVWGDNYFVGAKLMGWFWDMYAPNLYDCVQDAICSPLAASPDRLRNLTQNGALVVVGMADVLREEGLEFTRRLQLAGVPTELHSHKATHVGTAFLHLPATAQMFAKAMTTNLDP